MSHYNIVVSSNEATVVAEYTADYERLSSFQSEADLEREFGN